jgi:hypothetical protein
VTYQPSSNRWRLCSRGDPEQQVGCSIRNLWSQPLAGSSPKPLTDFKAERSYSFDWSRDSRLIVSRGVTNRDVVLIGGFKEP